MAKENRDIPKLKINSNNLRNSLKIFQYGEFQKKKFLFGMLFLLSTGGVAILFPKLMGQLIAAVGKDQAKLNQVGLWLLILFSVQAVFSYFRVYLFVSVTENLLASIRKKAYQHLIKMPLEFFSNNRVGDLTSRMSADIAQIQDTLTTTIAEIIRQLIIVIGGTCMLFFSSTKLALVMLAIIPVIAVFAVLFGRYVRKYSRSVQDMVAASGVILEESLQGIQVVKSFSNEKYESNRFTKKATEIRDIAVKLGNIRAIFVSFIIFCLMGSIIFLIWYALGLVNTGEMDAGNLTEFMFYTVFIAGSLGGLPDQFAQFQKGLGATDHLLELMNMKTETLNIENKNTEKLEGKIRFENLNFKYTNVTEKNILENINIEINKGETIALVGQSGAGKSTIASLILGFYPSYEGKLLIDGKELKNYDLHQLRKNMALVPQDVWLFGGSIRENIQYGNTDANEEEIMEAAKQANAWEFIQNLPEGMDTMVGERGVKLSGGQKQRVAIARAILRNPAILILDEATSALDSESEKIVQQALDNLMKNRTSIVIAHRLSTIKNADKIIVLDKGKIIEMGSHAELLKMDGIYNKLYQLQMY